MLPFVRALPDGAIIAEDLGLLTPGAAKLRDEMNFPGMRVLQFGFGNGAQYHLPHTYNPHCVAYTGTHDNNTAVGWFQSLQGKKSNSAHQQERRKALHYLRSNGKEIHWDMIRALLGSVAHTVMIPMQDILGLGEDARMNVPGLSAGNWDWRMDAAALSAPIAARMAELCRLFDRNGTTQT